MSASDLLAIERTGAVAHLVLNRPDNLNALSSALADAVLTAIAGLDAEDSIRCAVIRGNGKGFAAGADIAEMSGLEAKALRQKDYFGEWDRLVNRRLPLIAAVHGFALGGGCELTMMCDIIIAGKSAKFGQPEVKLGVMPGMGGTQRLTRLVGQARAMDLILTGRLIDATEAERIGLVSRVVADNDLLSTAQEVAETVAGYSKPSVALAREAVAGALDMPLADGLRFERRAFHSLFSGPDQREGMRAFLEKRAPEFTHE